MVDTILNVITAEPLDVAVGRMYAVGLAGAFIVTFGVIVLFLLRADRETGIDTGFLGLIVLLCSIFYLIAFSFLIAVSVKGLDAKLAVGIIDGLVLFGSKLLAPRFLTYLESE
jgi:hypothetical protein